MNRKILSSSIAPSKPLQSIEIPMEASKAIKAAFMTLFPDTSLQVYGKHTTFSKPAADILRAYLPTATLNTLEKVKKGEIDIIHLRNLPIDDVIPAGKDIEERLAAKTRVSELVIIGLTELMGCILWSNPAEHQGRPIHQVSPVAGNRGFSSLSKDPQFFHVEIPYEEVPPKFLALFCLDSDPNTRTIYIPVETLLHYIPKDLIEIMKKPDFVIKSGASYTTGAVQGNFSLIEDTGGTFRLRLMQKFDRFEGTTPETKRCLYDLYVILNSPEVVKEIKGVALKEGELLLFNNGKNTDGNTPCGVVHGRDVVGKDGKSDLSGTLKEDRWLQRGYLMAIDNLIPTRNIAAK